MADDSGGTGRREANKIATRAALRTEAARLFGERGFAETTVQDIADAAGVTERTFFRYFGSKEDLLVDDVLDTWLPLLTAAIRSRPAAEPPLLAVERALAAVSRRAAGVDAPLPAWLFAEGPPVDKLRIRRGGRPVREIEGALAGALRARLPEPVSEPAAYRCDVLARVALAAVRSALIRDWELRRAGRQRRPSRQALLRQAFAAIEDAAR